MVPYIHVFVFNVCVCVCVCVCVKLICLILLFVKIRIKFKKKMRILSVIIHFNKQLNVVLDLRKNDNSIYLLNTFSFYGEVKEQP